MKFERKDFEDLIMALYYRDSDLDEDGITERANAKLQAWLDAAPFVVVDDIEGGWYDWEPDWYDLQPGAVKAKLVCIEELKKEED